MTRGQRLAAILAAVAALLLLGRGTALLYVDRAWYEALGAYTVWQARVTNTVLMHTVAILIGTVFAYANIAAVRSSIISLIVPKQVGNVEIGEEISAKQLLLVAGGMSLFISIVASLTLPSWTTLALWRSGITFGESDPYFGFDIGYYVSWIPFETSLYVWAMVLFAIVSAVVVILYSLTPSLRWGHGTIRVTGHARRHLSVLGVILVLFVAWGFRLDAYETIVGRGGGSFTYFDHTWVIPTDLALSIVAIAAAVVLLVAGWMGQNSLAFISISVVLGSALISKVVLPSIGRYISDQPAYAKREIPYRATGQLFTRRAFPIEPIPPSTQLRADSTVLANAPRLRIRNGLSVIVYPHAQGVAVEPDTAHLIRSPRVGSRLQRVMSAWAEQNPQLLQARLPEDAAFVRRRDVRQRVTSIAPVFQQSDAIGARLTPTGLFWIIDLYSTSDRYPLSEGRELASTRITYRRHAATAYISGMTGSVTIVPDAMLDPIARAWFTQHIGPYLAARPPQEFTIPWTAPPSHDSTPAVALPDSMYRTHVLNIYSRMRAALDSGDFHAFADAFDSLGLAVGARPHAPRGPRQILPQKPVP